MIYLCNKLHSSLLRINTHSMLAIFVTILSSLSALTACSDDDTAFGEKGYGNDSEIISFSVNTSDGWNNATPDVRSYEQSSGTTSKSLTLTSSDAISDSARSAYYKNISGQSWGDASQYELTVDSSIGPEQTAQVILQYLNQRSK